MQDLRIQSWYRLSGLGDGRLGMSHAKQKDCNAHPGFVLGLWRIHSLRMVHVGMVLYGLCLREASQLCGTNLANSPRIGPF